MNEIIAYVVSAVVSAVGGAIIYFLKKHFKQLEIHTQEAEDRATQKDVLILKSLKAIGELTVANTAAVRNGHYNGETEKAQAEFESVDKELHAFLIDTAAKKINRKGGK